MIGWEPARVAWRRLTIEQGMTKTELAERFGISRQTIYRWIRKLESWTEISSAKLGCIIRPRI